MSDTKSVQILDMGSIKKHNDIVNKPSTLVKIQSVNGITRAVELDPNHRFYGWIFYEHTDGFWVSVRRATYLEMKGLK